MSRDEIIDMLMYVISVLLFILLLFLVSGCSGTIQNMREPDFTQGCKVVDSQIKLGYFNQEGQADACKLKCSKTLPDNFSYNYESRGCSINVGAIK